MHYCDHCFGPFYKALINELLARRYVSPNFVKADLNEFYRSIHNFWIRLKAPSTPQVVRRERHWRRFLELLPSQSRPLDGLSLHSQKLKTAAGVSRQLGATNKQPLTKTKHLMFFSFVLLVLLIAFV